MNRFASAQQAKEFLIAEIVAQAQREAVSLSDLERRMLYFSETAWMPPEAADAVGEFDAQYDQELYERKIAKLIRQAHTRARTSGEESAAWSEAIQVLSKGDHYILMMVERAGPLRPRFDFLKLVTTALAIVGVVVLVICLLIRSG
jgi:hypothetical protein